MVNLHAPKRTIPRTRPKKQPKAEPKDSIRAQLDQAQQGLDSMRELVDVLEAENASFGRYIESAEYKGSSSDEEPERQRGGLGDDGEHPPGDPDSFARFRPYLAHFSPVFSRFLRVFTVSPRRFQRTTSRNPGPRDSGKGAQTPFQRTS